jgi:hypothetical protein
VRFDGLQDFQHRTRANPSVPRDTDEKTLTLLASRTLKQMYWNFDLCQCRVKCWSNEMQISVTELSREWTVFSWLNTVVVDSNPTWDKDVCMRVFGVCVPSGLATGCSSVQGVLPTVHRIKKMKKRPRYSNRAIGLLIINKELLYWNVNSLRRFVHPA